MQLVDVGAFRGCTALNELTILGLNELGAWAFADCKSLTRVEFPRGAISLLNGTSHFENCTSLSEVIVNGTLTDGTWVFTGCNQISDVWVKQDTPFKINGTYFPESVYSTATLHVPCGSEESYEKYDVWMKFGKIQGDIASGIATIKHGSNSSEAFPYRLDGVKALSRKGIIIQDGRKRITGH